MTNQEHVISVEQFERIVAQPENADKLFEYIGGVVYEVPSNPYVSKIAGLILTFINLYLFEHDLGHATGEAGGYIVSGDRYAPDVAFISYEKQPELARSGYNPNPPDLAIEVLSSESRAEEDRITVKLSNYLAAGTVVWIVRVEDETIEVHRPGQRVQIVRKAQSIDGGDILPGFDLPLSQIFRPMTNN